MKKVDSFGLYRALETTGRFLGADGWVTVNPLLVKIMRRHGITGMGWRMHNGCFYQIRLEGVEFAGQLTMHGLHSVQVL